MNQDNDKLNNDIVKISQAMDAIAKLIIEKRKDKQQQDTNKDEYQVKLNNLTNLLNMILRLNTEDHTINKDNNIVDITRLDTLLKDKIDIIDKDGQEFALIPIVRGQNPDTFDGTDKPSPKKKNKKKKKNKILCSFCHQPGHTRAHCEKKLYNIQ